MFSVLERKTESRGVIAQVCMLLHVLEEKSHGGTKAHAGSPTHNMQDCTGANRRNHLYAITLAIIFVIFKVHVLHQLKWELLLGTSSVKIRGHFNSSPCTSWWISFALPGTSLSHGFTFELEMHCKPRRVISRGGIHLLHLKVSAM